MSLLLSLALGCAEGPYGAPIGSEVYHPSPYTEDALDGFVFDGAYNDPDDGLGLLVREQVLVMTPGTDWVEALPGNDILVEITSGWSAAYIIPATAVKLVDSYAAGCEGDASDECRAWFDIGTDTYYEFSGDYEDLGGFRPTYMSGGTDNRGILDFYVFIDSVPVDDEGEVISIPIYADIGVDITSWSYDFG